MRKSNLNIYDIYILILGQLNVATVATFKAQNVATVATFRAYHLVTNKK